MLEPETDGIHEPMARRACRVLNVLDHQLPAPLRLLIDEWIRKRRNDAGRRRRHMLAQQPLANEDAARRRRRVGWSRRGSEERALTEKAGALRVWRKLHHLELLFRRRQPVHVRELGGQKA